MRRTFTSWMLALALIGAPSVGWASTISDILFGHLSVTRPMGLDRGVEVKIDGRGTPVGAVLFARTEPGQDPANAGDLQAVVPFDCPILVAIDRGKLHAVQDGRAEDRKDAILAYWVDDDPTKQLYVLDQQNRHNEREREKAYKNWPRKMRRDEVYNGILRGVIYPRSQFSPPAITALNEATAKEPWRRQWYFAPGEVIHVNFDADENKQKMRITLVVSPYTLEQTLQLQAAAAGRSIAGPVVVPGVDPADPPTVPVPQAQTPSLPGYDFPRNGQPSQDVTPSGQPDDTSSGSSGAAARAIEAEASGTASPPARGGGSTNESTGRLVIRVQNADKSPWAGTLHCQIRVSSRPVPPGAVNPGDIGGPKDETLTMRGRSDEISFSEIPAGYVSVYIHNSEVADWVMVSPPTQQLSRGGQVEVVLRRRD